MKTLVKFIRDFISKCNDPVLIEHNQKQIKTIEGLLDDVKRAITNRDCNSMEASRLIESLFLLSSESLKDVQTSAMISSDKEALLASKGLGSDTTGMTGVFDMMDNKMKPNLKRRKINESEYPEKLGKLEDKENKH